MDSHIYNVSGGSLPGVYTTVQFHLHWGSNNNKGSEHTMDRLMYPAEVCYLDDMYCVQQPCPWGLENGRGAPGVAPPPPFTIKKPWGQDMSSVM